MTGEEWVVCDEWSEQWKCYARVSNLPFEEFFWLFFSFFSGFGDLYFISMD